MQPQRPGGPPGQEFYRQQQQVDDAQRGMNPQQGPPFSATTQPTPNVCISHMALPANRQPPTTYANPADMMSPPSAASMQSGPGGQPQQQGYPTSIPYSMPSASQQQMGINSSSPQVYQQAHSEMGMLRPGPGGIPYGGRPPGQMINRPPVGYDNPGGGYGRMPGPSGPMGPTGAMHPGMHPVRLPMQQQQQLPPGHPMAGMGGSAPQGQMAPMQQMIHHPQQQGMLQPHHQVRSAEQIAKEQEELMLRKMPHLADLESKSAVHLCRLGRDVIQDIYQRLVETVHSCKTGLFPPVLPNPATRAASDDQKLQQYIERLGELLRTVVFLKQRLETIFNIVMDRRKRLDPRLLCDSVKAIPFEDEGPTVLEEISKEAKNREEYKIVAARHAEAVQELTERQREMRQVLEFMQDLDVELAALLQRGRDFLPRPV